MNKGIFQSGSCGSCEKHSDVFHHIRFAHSPRAAVPHKSIEIPKPLLTLEDYKEAETKLEKRLLNEGYASSQSGVQKFARALKLLFFVLFFLPFYITIQLPLTLISGLFSLLRYVAVSLITPLIAPVKGVLTFFSGWKFSVNFPSWITLPSLKKTKETDLKNKEKTSKKSWRFDFRFWKNWQLPSWNFSFKQLRLPKFSFLNFSSISIPKWSWDFKKWIPSRPFLTRFSFRLPNINWSFCVSIPKIPKINLWRPKLPKLPVWLSLHILRKKIAIKTLNWDLAPFFLKLWNKIPRLRLNKQKKTQSAGKFKIFFQSLGSQIQAFLDRKVGKLPGIPQKILRAIGRGLSSLFGAFAGVIMKVVRVISNSIRSTFDFFAKIGEHSRKFNQLAVDAALKTKVLVGNGVDSAAKPLVKGLEVVHKKSIPFRLKLRKWTFLFGIAVELSLIFLSEAIIEFQEWNETRWIRKLDLR